MTSFDEIVAAATLPTRDVPLCLAGNLVAEYEQLERDLDAAPPGDSLAGGDRPAIVEKILHVQARMREATRSFRIRAMPARAWTRYWAAFPRRREGESSEAWNDREWPAYVDLVARSCVDPVLSLDQAGQIAEVLHGRAWNVLVNACIGVNLGDVDVPKFDAASAPSPDSELT